VILPEDATPTGAIETLEDAHKYARLFNEHRYELDGIISFPNFGDEPGIANALDYAQLNVPILVHAEGEFTDDPYGMDGGVGVCRVPNLQRLMKFMCKSGFEHHVGMARSHCADMISEAVNTYLGWDLYHNS
jgi:L-fucose isomerase-like protein